MSEILRRILLLVALTLCCTAAALAQWNYVLRSLDKRIEIRVRAADKIRYDVLLNSKLLLQDSTLSVDIDHHTLGTNPKVVGTT